MVSCKFPLNQSIEPVSEKWLWVNTYENTIFRGLFTSINPSYFDVNKKGVLLVLTHCQVMGDFSEFWRFFTAP